MATVYEKFAYQAKAIKMIESNLKSIRNLLGVADLNTALSTTMVTDTTGAAGAFKIKDNEFGDVSWEHGSAEYYIDPNTDVQEHKLVQDGSVCKLLGEMQAAIELAGIDKNLKEDLVVIVDAFQRLGFRPVPKS